MLNDMPRLREGFCILEEVVYISIDHIFPLFDFICLFRAIACETQWNNLWNKKTYKEKDMFVWFPGRNILN